MPTKDEWDKARAAVKENEKIRELLKLAPEADLLAAIAAIVQECENKKTP